MNLNLGKTEYTDQDHADLRARVKAKMAELGIAQAVVGREADVAGASLSQYLSATYTSEPGRTNIAVSLSRWLRSLEAAADVSQRLPAPPPFMPMHGSTEIRNILNYARATGSLVMIAGSPGVSKTATCLQYREDTPRAWYAAMDPTTSGVPTMLLEVLASMGVQDAKGTPQILMREVCRRAGEATGLLMIDEAQHLTPTAIEALRAINDRIGLGVAILGNEAAYSKVGATGGQAAFAQVSSRFAHRMFKVAPDPRDADTLAQAWASANREEIGKPVFEFCRAIAARPGGLRNISQSFKKALFAARMAQEPLDVSHLQGAFAQLSGGAQVR